MDGLQLVRWSGMADWARGYRFSARELNSSTGAEHPEDANFIKLCVGPFRGSDGWPG